MENPLHEMKKERKLYNVDGEYNLREQSGKLCRKLGARESTMMLESRKRIRMI